LRDATEVREKALNAQFQEIVTRLETACPEIGAHDG